MDLNGSLVRSFSDSIHPCSVTKFYTRAPGSFVVEDEMKTIKSISRPVEIGLRLTGIWPGSSYELVVRLVWILSMSFAQMCQFRYIVKHLTLESLTELVEGLGTSLPYTLLCFKLITFWVKRGTFEDMLVKMSNDWTNYSAANLNIDVMVKKAELAYRCSKLIMTTYVVAVFVYSSVFLEFVREFENKEADVTSRELLMKMDFPFAYYESPAYEYVFVVQFLQLLATASAIALLDALIVSLIFHTGGQIEVLHEALAGISVKDEDEELPKITVKSLIDRHYRIILNAENIENLFTYIALMQLLCNTLIICCIGFLITIALSSDESIKSLVKVLPFYVAITLEAFIFSFAGEYLSNKSLSVGSSAYGSLWYLLKCRDRRLVILLMIRSQRRLTITAGKFVDLSLEGFANILKASASYVSILCAMC